MCFSKLNSNMLLELLYHPQFLCERIFLKRNFSKFGFFFVTLPVFLYMIVALYILKIVWAWKLNHNKDSRHVSPITDSQTVQAQTVQTQWVMKPPVISTRKTMHCWWCAGLRHDRLQSLIPGQKNVVNTLLMNPEKVYLPPLQIKLGLIKNGSILWWIYVFEKQVSRDQWR